MAKVVERAPCCLTREDSDVTRYIPASPYLLAKPTDPATAEGVSAISKTRDIRLSHEWTHKSQQLVAFIPHHHHRISEA